MFVYPKSGRCWSCLEFQTRLTSAGFLSKHNILMYTINKPLTPRLESPEGWACCWILEPKLGTPRYALYSLKSAGMCVLQFGLREGFNSVQILRPFASYSKSVKTFYNSPKRVGLCDANGLYYTHFYFLIRNTTLSRPASLNFPLHPGFSPSQTARPPLAHSPLSPLPCPLSRPSSPPRLLPLSSLLSPIDSRCPFTSIFLPRHWHDSSEVPESFTL